MLLKYITLFSGFNFLVFSFILLLKKSPLKRPNAILGFTFLVMTLFSFSMYYLQNACQTKSSELLKCYIPIDYLLSIILGPGIYFYLREVINRPLSFRKLSTWAHAIAALPALLFIVYFMSLPSAMRVEKLLANYESLMWQGNILNLIFYLQMTSYLLVCFRTINKTLTISKKVTINASIIDISWLKTFFIIDLSIMFVTAPICFWVDNDYINGIIGQVAMDIQFIYIFVNTIWLHGVFPTEKVAETNSTENVEIKSFTLQPQEPALKITDKLADSYFERLIHSMEKDRLFLQKGCTIQQIATNTSIPLHHLSHILNSRLNKNFFDFINEYRVEEAKRMLCNKSYNQLTIEAIGFECGFGAKTSFNKAFKKATNQTPSEFRQLP